ncbi:MAG TPA: carbohydrate kinase [Candidatus Dormibacteraeota bacterium]|nr:carbohydrate kinase [Candidatus Dormibacteraeota bacterium]
MIVVCGEALIDIIQDGNGAQRSTPGGGPFNTARALVRLGVPTAFLGRLSDDEHGRRLAALLISDGVSLDYTSVGPEPTTTAFARRNTDGLVEYKFQIEGTSAPHLTPEMLPALLRQDVNALHVGTLGLLLEPMASTLAGLVRREGGGRMVMLDPNIRLGLAPGPDYRERLFDLIARSTIVKGSDEDMAWLYPGAGYEHAAEQLVAAGPALAVVTLGAKGAFGVQHGIAVRVESPEVKVVDTIGAGDAFGAGLLAWLYHNDAIGPDLMLEEAELRAALEFACIAAAMTTARAGADPPWNREMPEDVRFREGV